MWPGLFPFTHTWSPIWKLSPAPSASPSPPFASDLSAALTLAEKKAKRTEGLKKTFS